MSLHVHRSEPRDSDFRGSVVFLHGFPFDGSMWGPQLEALPDGWRGLAPDLRGFGRSDLREVAGEVTPGAGTGGRVALPHEPVLTMHRLADDVAALIQQEAAAPAVVCGLSMGGYVALALYRRRPELVRALVLADTRAEADTDEGRENRMRMAQSARESGAAAIARAMLPSILAERTMAENEETTDRVRAMILATPTETIIAALAGMATRRDATGELDGIDVPTLLLVGDEDRLTPPHVVGAMADRLPRGQLEVIPEAGHVSNLENPAAFNAALTSFLSGL
jgi:3-oxoadipate enol-lactonase